MDSTMFRAGILLLLISGVPSEPLNDNSSTPPAAPPPPPARPRLSRGINGGFSCAACTILLSLSEQVAKINNETFSEALQRMCTFIPERYHDPCQTLLRFLTPLLILELTVNTSPDTVCYGIGICKIDPGKDMCHLFPLPNDLQFADHRARNVPRDLLEISKGAGEGMPWICYIPGVKELCEAIDNVYDELVPAFDVDGDKFSPSETLRGSIWRGRDCSDARSDVYPGRVPLDGDRSLDSNCNGISGVNATSGLTLEDELCGGSGRRGVVFVGDSAAAHFHAPPDWFSPLTLTPGVLANVSYVISNEGDWPDLGFATGFRNTTMPALVDGPTDSIYHRLRQRNLCNHRDYQNLARNGAQSGSSISADGGYVKSLARDKYRDAPVVAFVALMGNDVCNEFQDTEAHMTTPEKFYEDIVNTLKYLDERLPPESHVVLVGLTDGGIIYDAMAHRYHPLGQLNKDLKYKDVYRWFNCMEMGPCHGWMTSNSTLRRITTKHARQLTAVLKQIAFKEKFPSFDVHFVANPFRRVINEWQDAGGQIWQLIEPVDSLHPTQAAQPLIASALWKHLERSAPHVLGPVNPRNDLIRKLFMEQGGH